MRNFNFLRHGALGTLGALTLALSGCYVAQPYGYTAYGTPVYTQQYPVVRYQSYPVQYAQPTIYYSSPTQPAPASQAAGSVYFDLNSSVIKPEYQNIVQAQADYLLANPSVHVTLQGNADDRGASGHNMSLGTRRANAVKLALERHGIAADRISTTSFGDRNPVDPDKNEAAYARNRRVDFYYQ